MTALEPERTANRPFRILVADDDRGNREAIADLLDARGFETILAADGGEAVEIVQVTTIHLCFLDMHMPRLTGLEALQLVRQVNELIPAILMTADATREVMRKALQERVHTVLPKPVSPNLALHAIAQALSKAYGPLPPATGATAPPVPPAPTRTVTQWSFQAQITVTQYQLPPHRSPNDDDHPVE